MDISTVGIFCIYICAVYCSARSPLRKKLTICSTFVACRLGPVPISGSTPLHSSGLVDTRLYQSQYSNNHIFLYGSGKMSIKSIVHSIVYMPMKPIFYWSNCLSNIHFTIYNIGDFINPHCNLNSIHYKINCD